MPHSKIYLRCFKSNFDAVKSKFGLVIDRLRRQPQNEDNLKNEDDLKNKDDLKKNIKNEDKLKNEDTQ